MIDSLAESLGSPVHTAAAVVAADILELVVATAREPGVYFLEDVVVPYQLTRPGPARTLLEERPRPLDDNCDWEVTLHAYVRSGFDPAQPAERATAFAAICICDLARHRAEAAPSA